MNISVYDFVNYLLTDDGIKIRIWHLTKEELIYEGYANEVPYNIESMEISSIDVLESDNPWENAAIEINVDDDYEEDEDDE